MNGNIQILQWNTHRLPAERMVKGRLLLLLQFSSASFFPIAVLALVFSSSGLPETPATFAGFLSPVLTSATGVAWKKLCRADCVFWAEAVQDVDGGVALAGFTAMSSGVNSTEEGRGAGAPWLAPGERPAETAGLLWTPGSEDGGLELLGWALQIKVSGFFPGL